MDEAQNAGGAATQVKWRPLSPRQRRVLGVLVEKAKTTPEAYPLSPNAIVTGCNQKSNRAPLTNYSLEDIEDVLTELREIGAVVELQGSGRVPRYKHCLYEWLGVDKVELAVMAELLLRGEQTVGELRTRAARMEPIADVAALRPILKSLLDKKLLMALTPEGRGQIVTHALYKDRELDELRARAAQVVSSSSSEEDDERPAPRASTATNDMYAELQLEVAELRAEVARLRERLEQVESLVRG